MEKRKERIDRGIKARSGDIFALTSWREMLYLAAPRLLPIVGLIVLSFALSIYWQRVLLSVCIFALLAISWDILAQTGMISLGQALFFGTGAYLSGILNHYWGWPPFITIPLATISGGLLCTAFLIPVLRLRGIFFSMVTLVLPLMLVRIIEATRIFGGTEGLSGLAPLPSSRPTEPRRGRSGRYARPIRAWPIATVFQRSTVSGSRGTGPECREPVDREATRPSVPIPPPPNTAPNLSSPWQPRARPAGTGLRVRDES